MSEIDPKTEVVVGDTVLTVSDIREMVRQLTSVQIKPTGNPPVFWFGADGFIKDPMIGRVHEALEVLNTPEAHGGLPDHGKIARVKEILNHIVSSVVTLEVTGAEMNVPAAEPEIEPKKELTLISQSETHAEFSYPMTDEEVASHATAGATSEQEEHSVESQEGQ